MSKRPQINVRSDYYTNDLVDALVKKTDKDKSKCVREAIEFYAVHVLGQDEVANLRLYEHFSNKENSECVSSSRK